MQTTPANDSRWFRAFLAGWAGVFLVLLAWFSTHRSSEATILGRYSTAYFAMLGACALLAAAAILCQRQPVYSRLHKFRHQILLLFLSISVSVIAVEVALRVLDPLGIAYFSESIRYQQDKLADPELNSRHAPGLRRMYQGVEVSINELGLRDRPLKEKQPGELRLLLLGDSVTFGWGVPVEATYGRRLEALLAARLKRPILTINSGVCGYSTTEEYAFLRRHGAELEPDLVLLLYVTNDIVPNLKPYDPWTRRSPYGKTPPRAAKILLEKLWLYRLGFSLIDYSDQEAPYPLDKNSPGVRESMDALAGMAAYCRERNLRFLTFFYRPRKGELKPPPRMQLSEDLLAEVRAVGARNGVDVVDVEPWWGAVKMRAVTNSVFDAHPNARGHEILATGIADYLLRAQLSQADATSHERSSSHPEQTHRSHMTDE